MTRLSDTQFAEHCRNYEVREFLQLADLLGSDLAAAKAMRAETEFVSTPEWIALNAPRNAEFAIKVRKVMVDKKMQWNNETLLAVCKQVIAESEGAL